MNISDLHSIDDLWESLRKRLAEAEYQQEYTTEDDFENDVWLSVVSLANDMGFDVGTTCLTSHTKRPGRSSAAWRSFCEQEHGPDVDVLDAKNRLDIVFKYEKWSIGIEVKCLGTNGHTAKLTQGIGQATLALAHRDRTLLIIHCGTVSNIERKRLRKVCKRMCDGMKTAVIA
ncbi:MAG TPA: hypothetical protein PKH03_10735 [Syntrophales bacterium]|nr:hypothetical protein [Syntrophales bacterium]